MVEAFGVQDTGELGTETGQTARLRVDALPARLDRDRAAARPPRTATVTAEQVARAVVKAIVTNAGQVIVQPGPVRALLALDTLLPWTGAAVSRALGVDAYMHPGDRLTWVGVSALIRA